MGRGARGDPDQAPLTPGTTTLSTHSLGSCKTSPRTMMTWPGQRPRGRPREQGSSCRNMEDDSDTWGGLKGEPSPRSGQAGFLLSTTTPLAAPWTLAVATSQSVSSPPGDWHCSGHKCGEKARQTWRPSQKLPCPPWKGSPGAQAVSRHSECEHPLPSQLPPGHVDKAPDLLGTKGVHSPACDLSTGKAVGKQPGGRLVFAQGRGCLL